MNDLIRRDDVLQAIHGYWYSKINELPTENTEDGEIITNVRKANEYLEHNKQLSLFIQLIKAVEVVRCKECKWYKDFDGCFFSTTEVEEDGFCSYGERTADETD